MMSQGAAVAARPAALNFAPGASTTASLARFVPAGEGGP
jgi:hypothetical protein